MEVHAQVAKTRELKSGGRGKRKATVGRNESS